MQISREREPQVEGTARGRPAEGVSVHRSSRAGVWLEYNEGRVVGGEFSVVKEKAGQISKASRPYWNFFFSALRWEVTRQFLP